MSVRVLCAKFSRSSVRLGCVLYVSNTFDARYKRVEYALNAFGIRFNHASVRSC